VKRKKSILILVIPACLIAILYSASYLLIAEKNSGRARGAGMYFHYRFFQQDWLGVIFYPAAWIESKIIQFHPEPFLPNPSWATEPQALILQTPDRNVFFSRSRPQEETSDLMTSQSIKDGKGNTYTIKR